MRPLDTAALAAEILNSAWWVRNCRRNRPLERRQALARMGATVAGAFTCSSDYEALLYAVAQGLYDPRDPRFQV